jgi:small subunit ribosomal protein S20
MPNIKSAKKRAIQSKKKHSVNVARKSSIKTAVKKVLTAVEIPEVGTDLKQLLKDAESQIARARGKGVLHKNTAARKISRLAKAVAAAEREKGNG